MTFTAVAVAEIVERARVADKSRLAVEVALMAARTSAKPVLINEVPAWLETISGPLTRRRYLLVVGLPASGWPWTPPWARVVEPEIPSNAPHGSGGGLCLWHVPRPSISALYARNRAALWVACFEDWLRTGVWPTARWRD